MRASASSSDRPARRIRWDPWWLALGTLTAVPVPAPSRVDRHQAGWAMTVAPLVAIPVALALAVAGLAGSALGVPGLALAGLQLALLALSSRCLHLDGLADTCDGLTSSYTRQRALDVMRRGDAGPAGVVAVVLVMLTQAGCLAVLSASSSGTVLAATAVVVSRSTLTVACRESVPAARSDGLGGTVAGSVPALRVALAVAVVGAAATAIGVAAGHPGWAGVAIVTATLLPAQAVLARAVRRLGGITGDVLGAAVEIGLAGGLVAASCLVT